ncbi:BQ5605_C001g00738 [Microbotryum silenes-dioicae]|uniref:FAD synthase n=1 Tax=Microbotryum silenes-dioicae TaxID=796604 RepID=A0A2X0M8A4_9BASI|nr:BQ5605_C001g00738 [Microbotryum silenes-dioicae]
MACSVRTTELSSHSGSCRTAGSTSNSTSPTTSTSTSTSRSREFGQADADAVYKLALENLPLGLKVKDALRIIDQAIEDYGLQHVALSFNGGKDCTVLVHLLAAAAFRSQQRPTHNSNPNSHSTSIPSTTPPPTSTSPPHLECVYVRCASPFPQVETFVETCTQRYHLNLRAVDGGMKEALQNYLDQKKQEVPIQAVLVGTRRHDPHGVQHLAPFARTDGGWPDFMRVHPILDWTYKEIWDFLRHPDLTLGGSKEAGLIEWCELYDYGYTSLGSTHNTFPNPMLKAIGDTSVKGGWRPAWELKDETQERAGRDAKLMKQVIEVEEQIVTL